MPFASVAVQCCSLLLQTEAKRPTPFPADANELEPVSSNGNGKQQNGKGEKQNGKGKKQKAMKIEQSKQLGPAKKPASQMTMKVKPMKVKPMKKPMMAEKPQNKQNKNK